MNISDSAEIPVLIDGKLNLAILASGSGSNFEAIARAARDSSLKGTVKLCLSDNPEAGVLSRARSYQIPAEILTTADFPSKKEFSEHVLDLLDQYEVNFIALAGYLKLIPESVTSAFHHRIVNIHPALLPAFGGKGMYGLHVHRAAIEHGVRWSGATVHLVDESYDTGPIVLQEPVPVLQHDTPESLAARVLEVEHRLYPKAINLFAEGRIAIEGRRVIIHERKLN